MSSQNKENTKQIKNIKEQTNNNSIDTTNKYKLQTINSIPSFSDNSISIQQNIFTTFQSGYSKFITNIIKSYWNNFLFPTPYLKLYNNTNQIIIDNTINTSRMLNDLLESHIEPFNISVELTQKYYNNGIRNYFNFSKKIIEMIYNH
jgi:hypothetical protein